MNPLIIPFDNYNYNVLPFVCMGVTTQETGGSQPVIVVFFVPNLGIFQSFSYDGRAENTTALAVNNLAHPVSELSTSRRHYIILTRDKEETVTKNQTATTVATFNFNNHKVRNVLIDNEPWFVLTDVCKILGLANSRLIKNRLEDDVYTTYTIPDSLGRKQPTTIINEDGLYDCIFESRKPNARKFRKWITSEVLPSIRKTGSYTVEDKEVEYTFPMDLAFEFIHLGTTALSNNISHSIKRIRKELVELKLLMVEHMDKTHHTVHHLRPYRFIKVAKNNQSLTNKGE